MIKRAKSSVRIMEYPKGFKKRERPTYKAALREHPVFKRIRHECFDQYATIECENGFLTYISPKDFWWVICFEWYAKTFEKTDNVYIFEKWTSIPLARMIAAVDEREVDHINGNTLDNRRENLRPATRSEQMFNTRGHAGRALPKNVSLSGNKFCARIMQRGKRIYGGSFESVAEASFEASNLRHRFHGDFARG